MLEDIDSNRRIFIWFLVTPTTSKKSAQTCHFTHIVMELRWDSPSFEPPSHAPCAQVLQEKTLLRTAAPRSSLRNFQMRHKSTLKYPSVTGILSGVSMACNACRQETPPYRVAGHRQFIRRRIQSKSREMSGRGAAEGEGGSPA